jgi:hypothetical protein
MVTHNVCASLEPKSLGLGLVTRSTYMLQPFFLSTHGREARMTLYYNM